MSVETVLGPVDSSTLGAVHMHEHLFCDLDRIPERFTPSDPLDNVELVGLELQKFRSAGGSTIVELTLPAIGRNSEALRQLALATGINIVMGCGWYREPYYPADLDETSTTALADSLIREITEGESSGGIRPGIIGEIGSHKAAVTAQEERVFRAVGRAAVETGLSVSTHSLYGTGLDHIQILREEGLDPSRIVVGHSDISFDVDYYHAILRSGATVQFDQIGIVRSNWWESKLIDIVAQLVGEGYGGQIVLSSDVCRKAHLVEFGGPGYEYLLATFVPRLQDRIGMEAATVILQDTPRRVLEMAN